jgi:hypothetical protein
MRTASYRGPAARKHVGKKGDRDELAPRELRVRAAVSLILGRVRDLRLAPSFRPWTRAWFCVCPGLATAGHGRADEGLRSSWECADLMRRRPTDYRRNLERGRSTHTTPLGRPTARFCSYQFHACANKQVERVSAVFVRRTTRGGTRRSVQRAPCKNSIEPGSATKESKVNGAVFSYSAVTPSKGNAG